MSDNQSRGTHVWSKYDTMETEKLEEILRLDAKAPQGQESDIEEILYIMEVLAQRNENSTGKTALEAWNTFQQEYLCDVEASVEKKRTLRPWLRGMIAAAAAIVILVAIPLSAKAFRWDAIWDTFAKWAKETFSFVSVDQPETTEPNPDNIQEYSSLQDALVASNRNPNIVPTWIPDGYILDEIKIFEAPNRKTYIAFYHNGKSSLKFTVQSYLGTDAEKIEIGPDLIEIYGASDNEYYIFDNHEQLRAVWIQDSYECFISGELTIAEMKMMIDSIGKG